MKDYFSPKVYTFWSNQIVHTIKMNTVVDLNLKLKIN